jgi:hypothetical protein
LETTFLVEVATSKLTKTTTRRSWRHYLQQLRGIKKAADERVQHYEVIENI